MVKQKSLTKIIQPVFGLIFLLLSTSMLNAQGNKSLDGVIAVVGNKIILQSDLEAAKNNARTQGLAVSLQSECGFLENLLFQSLLIQQAEFDSLEVPSARVEQEMDRKLQYFITQIGGVDQLERFYEKSIEEMKDEFREGIKEQLMAQMMQAQIVQNTQITPSEVYEFYNSLPSDSIPEIEAQVEVQQIVIQPEIGDQEINKVKEDLQKWRDEVASGKKSISTVAVLYSDDMGTRANGGKTGFQQRGTFVPEFEAVAYSLQKGEVSSVFKTEFGYHFMQLIERRGESVNVAHVLRKPKVKAENLVKAKREADSVYAIIKTDSLNFTDAVRKFSDDVKTKQNKGLIQNPYTLSTKFDLNLLKQVDQQLYYATLSLNEGDITTPSLFQSPVDGESYKIFMLKEKVEKHKANLKQDYQVLEQMAKSKLDQEVVNKWIADKLQTTYIKLKPEYAECDFEYAWLKN